MFKLVSKFYISNARLSDEPIKKGPNAGKHYLIATVKECGNINDNGREVNIFAQDFVAEFNAAKNEDRDPDWDKVMNGAVFDKESIDLGGIYHHFSYDASGNKVYTLDEAGNPRPYTSMRPLVLFKAEMQETFDENGMPKFLGFNPVTGEPVYAPPHPVTVQGADGIWRIKRLYIDGWSPQDRRDQALQQFFEKVGNRAEFEAPAASGFTLEAPQPAPQSAQQPAQATVQPIQQPAQQPVIAQQPPV